MRNFLISLFELLLIGLPIGLILYYYVELIR